MQDNEFEWRDQKAASNLLKHGVSFEMARETFKDAFALSRIDRGHDDVEERFVLLGMVENRLLFVSYTLRNDRIHIISARKAEPHERRQYHNENRYDGEV
jgi:uncharacterized protein